MPINAPSINTPTTDKPQKFESAATIIKITAMLIGMFAFLQVYSIQSILPVLMVDFMANEVQVGMAVGATVMAVGLMSPIMGMISDAIGRKAVIVVSLILLAMPTALIAISDSMAQIVFWRFSQGLFVPGITVVTIAYIGDEFKTKPVVQLMSFYVAGSVLGGFLGRFLLGHLEKLIGWRNGFYVMAALTAIGAVWVGFVLPASKNFAANPNFHSAITILKKHLKNRYVISASLLGFCVLFSLVGCFTFINLHLSSSPYHLDTGQLANIFCVYLLGVIVTPLSTRIVQRFGSRNTIVGAILLSMLGIMLTLSYPLWLIIIGLGVMSTGVFVTQSATISYIATNVHEGRSLASGLYYMSYYLGGTCGAWVCGLLYTQGKWSMTVIGLVTLQIIAIMVGYKGMIKMQRCSY